MKKLLLLLLTSSQLFAGQGKGGGDVVLCYQSVEVKERVKTSIKEHSRSSTPVNLMLDKLEGEVLMLETYMALRPVGLFDTQVLEINSFSASEVYEIIKDNVSESLYKYLSESITKDEQWRSSPYGVLEVHDSGYIGKIAPNCLVVQVAHYLDDINLVYFDSRITSLMNAQELRTLKIHEDLYRRQRFLYKQSGKRLKSSMTLREAVTYFITREKFDDEGIVKVLFSLLPPDRYWLDSPYKDGRPAYGYMLNYRNKKN